MVDAAAPKLSEEEMQMIYNWVDEIPLSRPKRNIARDFSDGGKILMEIQILSIGCRDCEAFCTSYCRASQLFCSSFSFSEDLQLEHIESENL
jgi:hypothetical protein